MALDNPLSFSFGDFLIRFAVDAKGRHRPRFEPLDADLLAARLADSELAIVEPLQSFLNFKNQFTFAIADAQERIAIRLHRRSVGRIGEVLVVIHRFDGFPRFRAKFLDPLVEKIAK